MRRIRARRPRNDVAIYSPFSSNMYERRPRRAGGAERQMALLARGLAERGLRVAHVVWRPEDPVLPGGIPLELVARGPYAGGGARGRLLEALRIWGALRRADAAIYLVRGSSPAVGVTAAFCRARGRRLVFSSANDLDFTLERLSDRRHRSGLYRFGVGSAAALVVQSEQQRALAREAFPGVPRAELIRSFGEAPLPAPASPPPPEAFLWVGRLIEYKQPLEFLRLARELPDARFWMIGVDNEGDPVAGRVREQAAGLANLELLEPRPHAETMDLVERSAAVVSTSRREGMPNVFLEAWTRGVPVLTLEFDPDGIVAREGLGISAEGDWAAFVAGARAYWQSGAERERAGRRGRAYMAEHHAPDAVAGRWRELLGELLDEVTA